MRFAVVTKLDNRNGNMATALGDVYVQDEAPGESNNWLGTYKPLPARLSLDMFTPVWKLGEIVVLDDNDRTIPDGRKPSKWFITTEEFDNIEDAMRRSREVVDDDS
jgi:hypothetical protein